LGHCVVMRAICRAASVPWVLARLSTSTLPLPHFPTISKTAFSHYYWDGFLSARSPKIYLY
jgi:hypothetical protein